MRGLPIGCVALLLTVAGCIEEPTIDPAGAEVDEPDETADAPAKLADLHPGKMNETVAVHWNGTLGTQVNGCEWQNTATCSNTTISPDDSSTRIDAGGAMLRTLELTLTWESGTSLSERLAVEVSVNGECRGCNATVITVEGTSPIVVDMAGLAVWVMDLVVSVDNPGMARHHPPLDLQGSIEQTVRLDGSFEVEYTLH